MPTGYADSEEGSSRTSRGERYPARPDLNAGVIEFERAGERLARILEAQDEREDRRRRYSSWARRFFMNGDEWKGMPQ